MKSIIPSASDSSISLSSIFPALTFLSKSGAAFRVHCALLVEPLTKVPPTNAPFTFLNFNFCVGLFQPATIPFAVAVARVDP